MLESGAKLRRPANLPITWLSNGSLKTSIVLREEAGRTGKNSEALAQLLQENLSKEDAFAAIRQISKLDSNAILAASEDYSRCILAKAVSEVYRNMTSKYRNEAARKQFLKRLADVIEAVHLSESTSRLREIFSTSTHEDEVTTWVSLEVERLTREKADLDSEYNAKLNAARVEFATALRQIEQLVDVKWAEADNFTRSLRISSFFPPGLLENENTWRWGSQWYAKEGVLNINPPILFLDPIRRGVLVREAASLMSPRNLEALARELSEQSEYLAYRLFERKTDREFWAEARHGLRQKTRFRAQELIEFFHFYEMMVGESLYRELWSRLNEFGDARLTFADYLTVFNSLASRPTDPKFSEQELRLLDLLCKHTYSNEDDPRPYKKSRPEFHNPGGHAKDRLR
jgi:hypothetical protein